MIALDDIRVCEVTLLFLKHLHALASSQLSTSKVDHLSEQH